MGDATVKKIIRWLVELVLVFLVGLSLAGPTANAGDRWDDDHRKPHWKVNKRNIQIGLRPYYLIQNMEESRLKRKLEDCTEGPFEKTDFSIGHRGAALQFLEHTKESYEAAARMGAGIIECDVTFTADRELVCRHSQCDLHTTTDILLRPGLAAKCSEPF
jgi:glycerophosphoryl diester phosphodiesterase